jgi:predicted nucleotidyltransferase component of viral defense system
MKMALKGGTGIRKVYMEGFRFSDDLDFTFMEEYTLDESIMYLDRH